MPIPEEGRGKIFVSYSHTDSDWLKRLQIHMKPLERDGLVDLWNDTRIQSGSQWREELRGALDSASAAVLLISADFLASDFITENELPLLLAAAEKDGVAILPLILSPSRFEKIESLARFQSVNPPSKPLIELSKAEQERYLVKLSDDVLRVIEEAQMKPTVTGGAGRPQIFNVPFPRNKFFTGRSDILERLHTSFNDGERVQAINGMGGVGKTQAALEYAYRYREKYQVVLWANSNSRETLVTDFTAIAGLLNLPEKSAQDQSEAVAAVKRWLTDNSAWLLILDNADEIETAEEFIPPGEAGHIILTTRAHAMGEIGESNALEKMTPEEGALFLLRRLRKVKKDDAWESAAAELLAQAEALSTLVDGLPLALDQAAAFIEEKPSTLEEYRTLYQSERRKLLERRGKLAKDHPSVTVTFSLAFKKVEEANPVAADLLRLCAFLEADSIPEEIFGEGVTELGETLASIAESPLSLIDAIEEACRFSLMKRQPEDRTLSIHRLAQAVLKDEMDEGNKQLWVKRATRAMNKVFPDIECYNWPACDRLIPHAQALASNIEKYGLDLPEAATMLDHTGSYLDERGQYTEVEPFYRLSLAIQEKILGPEHPDVAATLHRLALHFNNNQGKYTEAGTLFHRALSIYENALGPEHPSVAHILISLAGLYYNQAKYAEVEPLLNRAMEIFERESEADHQRVVSILHIRALLYGRYGRYVEAEHLLNRALAIFEQSHGEWHPHIANLLDALANIYHEQEKQEEIEPLLLRALAIREYSFGLEHPDVAESVTQLAGLYNKKGKYIEAKALFMRAMAINEKATIPKHLYIANSLNGLAELNKNQGEYAEAEPFFLRALAIYEKELGPDDPHVANSLSGLAGLYSDQGKYAKAEPLYMRALTIYEKTLGAEHPAVATTLENYASVLRATDKDAEDEKLESRASAIRENSRT